ncbi:MAG: SbcC/MukB-like Walker B domain-containing protein, partial [Marmoricola sp.]
ALLHRVSEATGAELPPGWESDDLAALADDGRIETWVTELAVTTAAVLDAAQVNQDAAAAHLENAVLAHDEGRATDELRARHTRATRMAEQLAGSADDAAADRRRLADARRAAVVRPLALVADDAAATSVRAGSAATRAIQAVAQALTVETDALDDTALAAQARDATQRAAVARSFLPRARELTEISGRLARVGERIGRLERDRGNVAERAGELRPMVVELTQQVADVREEAALVPEARQRVSELAIRVLAFATADELDYQVGAARRKYDAQRELTIGLKEQLVDLRESRLQGMAAELATAMVVGEHCPVCGSHDHPAPASAAPGAPTRSDEQALRDRVDDAEIVQEAHADQVRGYQSRLVAAREGAGPGTSDEIRADLEQARAAASAALASAAELAATERRLAETTRSELDATATLGTLDADLRVAREQKSAAETSVAALNDQLAKILGSAPGDAPDLDALIRRHEESAILLATARDALVEQARGADRARESAAAAVRAAGAAGFDDLGTALDAVLAEHETADLQVRTEARQLAETEAAMVLADPAVREAAAAAAPDVPALRRSREEAGQAHTGAASALRLAAQRRERLAVQLLQLRSALAAWAPQRADHAVLRSLAELVEGRGADNSRQMRLSGYVLAARLSQVVAAANERLGRMTDDRYLLEHTAQRGVGERRGALGLLVRDQWTGEQRDPVTLSGGETFVVSLALALGLADVVTGEAGGAGIETLFVDEGFGALDSDTLELVMDTLDQLREGGRVVGVVSHVPELRTRIPAQLVVHKTRSGSTLDQRLGAG